MSNSDITERTAIGTVISPSLARDSYIVTGDSVSIEWKGKTGWNDMKGLTDGGIELVKELAKSFRVVIWRNSERVDGGQSAHVAMYQEEFPTYEESINFISQIKPL